MTLNWTTIITLATHDRLVISSPLFHYMSLMTRYPTYFRHARGEEEGGGESVLGEFDGTKLPPL
jgi:hypothetical protein